MEEGKSQRSKYISITRNKSQSMKLFEDVRVGDKAFKEIEKVVNEKG